MTNSRPWFKSYDEGVPHSLDASCAATIAEIFSIALEKYPNRTATWCWNESALRRRPRPASMAQALERRLARVGDGELQLLQALALLDRAVERELLERVAAASPRSETATPDDVDWTPQHRER